MEETIDKCLKIILDKVLCCSMTNDEAVTLIKELFNKKHTVEVPYQPYDPFKPTITWQDNSKDFPFDDPNKVKCEGESVGCVGHSVGNCDLKGSKLTTGSYVDGKFTYTEETL